MVFRGPVAFFRALVQAGLRLITEIQTLLEKGSKIRLRGGVVGKVSTVLFVACIALAAIAWSAKIWWISLVCALLLVGLCFPLLWRLISFAQDNPYAALFEGAELLAHERLKLGTKQEPSLPAAPIQTPIIQLEGEKQPPNEQDEGRET